MDTTTQVPEVQQPTLVSEMPDAAQFKRRLSSEVTYTLQKKDEKTVVYTANKSGKTYETDAETTFGYLLT